MEPDIFRSLIDSTFAAAIVALALGFFRLLFSMKSRDDVQQERLDKTDQDVKNLSESLAREVETSSRKRREMHEKIDAIISSARKDIRSMRDHIDGRLDVIISQLSSYESRQATIESQVKTIDERGTKGDLMPPPETTVDWRLYLMSGVIILGYFILTVLSMLYPPENNPVVQSQLDTWKAFAFAILGYWYGSSKRGNSEG